MNRKQIIVAVGAAIVATAGAQAAPPAVAARGALLVPLRADDVSAFTKELPGENLGDGGEFSIGRNRYIRLEGRHLTFRTATGVKACVVAPAAAKSVTFDTTGTLGCGGLSLTVAVDKRRRSDMGQPVVVTVAQGARVSTMRGLWQGLD